jgi:hypothetical protein
MPINFTKGMATKAPAANPNLESAIKSLPFS